MRCANGFSVTRPSLNQSFTIRHTVSLPLRRHSRTQSQLATSVKRHSVPRTWKSWDSRSGHFARRDADEADDHALPQLGEHGRGGKHSRQFARRGGAADRLR